MTTPQEEYRAKCEANKAAILADEGRFQRVCSAYVGRNVIYCVSSLMYGIAQIMYDCRNFHDAFGDHPEDLEDALFRRRDYREPVEAFIDEADLDDLERAVDELDDADWDDILEDAAIPTVCEVESKDADGDPITLYVVLGINQQFDDEDEAIEAARNFKIDAIREAVKGCLVDDDDYRRVADEFRIEPEDYDVYEHWIVDSYFSRELEACGELISEFGGMTIWGRCTTGQSISIDGVVRQIVREKDADHWIWSEG